MSVINKMLQELDQRQAVPPPGGPAVRPTRARADTAGENKATFWRVLALLMLASVVWVAVLAFQLETQPLVTNLAYKAAQDALSRPAPLPSPPAAPPPLAMAAPPPIIVAAAEPRSALPAAPPQLFKVAPAIETPLPAERARRPAGPQPLVPAAARPPGPVEKVERSRTPQGTAETEFRRAVGLLSEGRNADAQDALAMAIRADPGHEAARQTLAALLIEQRKLEAARTLLQDGLAHNPGNTVFAYSLARILTEGKDYDGALAVLQSSGSAGESNAGIQALAGAIQQRLGRHREALGAYQAAVRLAPASGSSWMGLGISLEALEHRPEAAEAFRRAIASGSLSAELSEHAATRLARLQ